MRRTPALALIGVLSLTIFGSWLIHLTIELYVANVEEEEEIYVPDVEEEMGLVTVNGSHLYVEEKRFTFLGANSFELWQYSPANITKILDMAHDHGIKVIRVFLGGTAFEDPLGTYNELNLKKLDYVLAYSRFKGIYVIVTLRDLSWDADVYWVELYGSINRTRMFTDPTMIEAYQKFIETVMNRINIYNDKTYKNDPTILAWDICNEPNRHDDAWAVHGDALGDWVEEISGYVKSVDPTHLVTVGLDGWGETWKDAYTVQDFVDFTSIHLIYNNLSINLDDSRTAFYNLSCSGKPLILEEFGVDKALGLTPEAETEIFAEYLKMSSNASGAMFWNLGMGNNPWDRWIGGDSHLFDTFMAEQWVVEEE